jgi:hypothetical protein
MGICKHQNEELWGEMKNLNRRIAMIVIQLNWIKMGGWWWLCCNIMCVPPQALNLMICLVGRSVAFASPSTSKERPVVQLVFSARLVSVNVKIHGFVWREAITVVFYGNTWVCLKTESTEFQQFVTHFLINMAIWGDRGHTAFLDTPLIWTWFISGPWIFDSEDLVDAYWTVPTTTTTTTGLPVNAAEALKLGSAKALILPFPSGLLGRVRL